MSKYAAQIKRIIKQRNISFLVHFTHVDNLPSILKHGLVPRAEHFTLKSKPVYSDSARYDGRLDSTSISISQPNDKMFYHKRKQVNDVNQYVFLILNTDVLWQKDVAFYAKNAACNEVRFKKPYTFKNHWSFEAMFEDNGNRGDLEPFQTTDVQAEALVFDTIEPFYIEDIVFHDRYAADQAKRRLGNAKNIVAAPEFYQFRDSYQFPWA